MPTESRLEKATTQFVGILEAEENKRLDRLARHNEQLGQIAELFDEIHTQNQRIVRYGKSIDMPIREGELLPMPEPIVNFLTILIHGQEDKAPLLRLKTMEYPGGEREMILRVVFDLTSDEGAIYVHIPAKGDLKVTAEAKNTNSTGMDVKQRSEQSFEQDMQPDQFTRGDAIDIQLAVAEELLMYVSEQGANAIETQVKDASNR